MRRKTGSVAKMLTLNKISLKMGLSHLKRALHKDMENTALGKRIADLRKYLRISQTIIGKEIFSGKSRQYVASIESGERIPTSLELKFLAILFRLPKFDSSYLLEEDKYSKICSFKLSSELPAIQRRGKEDSFDEKELYAFVQEIDEKCEGTNIVVNTSAVNIAKQSLPTKFKTKSIETFLQNDLGFNVIEDNLFLLPSKLGILLKFTALSQLSGACIKTERGNYGILINSNQLFARQRFNLMHELGHFFLGHNEKEFIVKTPLGRCYEPEEVDADTFAAEMLMPYSFILSELQKIIQNGKDYKEPRIVYELTQKLNVSYSAFIIRLKNLEFINSQEMDLLSKISPSSLNEGKLVKENPEDQEYAKQLISREIELADNKFTLGQQLSSPSQLRNFQEGIYSKLLDKLSARLAYEQVATILYEKTVLTL